MTKHSREFQGLARAGDAHASAEFHVSNLSQGQAELFGKGLAQIIRSRLDGTEQLVLFPADQRGLFGSSRWMNRDPLGLDLAGNPRCRGDVGRVSRQAIARS